MIKNASDTVISRKQVNIICWGFIFFILGHYTEKNAIFYLKLENLLCDTGASQNHFHCCFVAQMLHWESNVQDKYEKKKKITTKNRRKRKKEILYLVFVIRLFLIMFWGRKNRKELCSSSLLLRYSLVTWKWQRKKSASKNVDVSKWERAPQSSFELIKFISRARNIPCYISPCKRDFCVPY